MKFFAFSFLMLSFLASITAQNTAPSTGAVKAKTATPTAAPTNSQKFLSTSGKSMKDLLKDGQQGLYKRPNFAAIIESDFAVGITSNSSGGDMPKFDYKVTTYAKEGTDWKVKTEKVVAAEDTDEAKIELEDMDKDGKKDIMLLLAQDGRGNQQYALFLLKTKALVEVKGFNEAYAPTYDEKKKAIKSTSTNNGGQDVEFYKIVNGELVKVAGK